MDLGRFHYAIDSIVKDWKSVNATQHLQALIGSLSNIASNPGHPQLFQQYKDQLQVIADALSGSKLNKPQLEIADAIKSFELGSYTGNAFFSKIKNEIEQHQLSPQAAVNALQKLLADYQQKLATLSAISDGLGSIGADYDQEADGDAEIEISIPAEYGERTLADLAREAKEWHRDLHTISETFDPDRPEPTIRVLSTGSWEFFLASTPLAIYGISKCLKGINVILEELIKSRKLLDQLLASKAPAEVTKPYEEHLQSKVRTDFSQLASSLVDEFYKGDDSGRREELKNALTQSLRRLSKKLSEGSKVSLRLTKPAEPKVENAESLTEDERRAIENAERIEKIRLETSKEIEATPKLGHDAAIAAALPAPDQEVDE
jgi:hypothetical protein